jgi:hypothetical protein
MKSVITEFYKTHKKLTVFTFGTSSNQTKRRSFLLLISKMCLHKKRKKFITLELLLLFRFAAESARQRKGKQPSPGAHI